MTQEDIIDLREKNMPQWQKDQLNAIAGNVDYVNILKRKIEHLEKKLKLHNSEYAVALRIYNLYSDDEESRYITFGDFLKECLNSGD